MAHTSFENADHDASASGGGDMVGHDGFAKHSEEETLDEINRYMSELLDRTGQRSAASTASTPEKTPAEAKVTESPEGVPERPSNAQRRLQDHRRVTSQEPTPLAHPKPLRKEPAQEIDLSAMREVAKNSAQDAISIHDSKQVANRARGKLSVAVVATCAAVLLFWMDPSYKATTFPAALLASIVAVTWSGNAVRLVIESQRMIRNQTSDEIS